jgi:acyl-CoA thioester hydrolase
MKIVIADCLKTYKKNERYFKTVPVISTLKCSGGNGCVQHVNNVVYVRWGETARIDYFRALGFFSSEDDKMKTGIIRIPVG